MVLQQRVQLDEFILCPVNQHLELGTERIPLEPKVYEVLCYLLQQQERFVSLEELHQQVWAGRVVSDTAVRRSISKLRAALNDQQEPPRFIQSAAKRGYRWLVTPKVLESEPLSTDPSSNVSQSGLEGQLSQTSAAPVAVPVGIEETSTDATTVPSRRRSLHRHWHWGLAALLLLAVAGWFWQQQQPYWQLEPPLSLVEGEKLSMDVSPDGNQLIFTGKTANHIGWEIYSYHRSTGVLQQLTSGDNQIMHAALAKDGKSLFYHNFKNNTYDFFQQDLTTSGQLTGSPRLLLSGYDVMLDIQPQPDLHTVLLNLGSKNGKGDQSQIQRLDLRTGALSAVTSSMIAGVHDTAFAVSPDQQRLIFQRQIPGQSSMLIEQDIASGNILRQILYPARIFDLHWLSSSRLFILDEEALFTFDLTKQKRQPWQSNTLPGQVTGKGLSRMMLPLNTQQWLMFKHAGDLSKMLHQQGKIGALNERVLIHTPDYARNIYFTQQPEQFFVHLQRDDVQQIILQQADGAQQPLLEVKGQQVSFQQMHPNGTLLLLLLDGKPQLFDLNNRQLTALNVAGNQWQSAYFMPDSQDILLTSKTHGEYQTFLYQSATGQSQALFRGYSLVIPYLTGQYIAVREDLSFVMLHNGVETALNARLNPPFPGSVHLRQHQLFWGETDLKTTSICRYQLQQQQQQCWQQDRRQLMQRFDVSPDGEQWLLRHMASIDTKIHPVSTNIK
jgi:DNA-binding winged helix-turn-helix (wHTH) protein